ncbi:MAG: flippase-like domain-containing protein [Actinobacteria bacterium]|nr:flippase-like domain-containing protein [Actinomycetota bacterium]
MGTGPEAHGTEPPTPVAPTPGPSARRARFGLGLRMFVSAVLLAVLVSKIDFEGAMPRDRHLDTILYFAAAVLTATIGIVLSAWRWQRVLEAFGAHVPLAQLTNHYFAGQFLGNVLPSTIGGDVLRVSRSAKTIDSTETAFAAVALERLTGFLALPLLCLVGFALDPSLLESRTAWVALLVSGVTLAALGVIVYLAGHPRVAGRFREHESWMRFIGAAHDGIEHLRGHPRAALGVLGTALVYQVSVLVTVGFIVLTLGADVPAVAVIAFVPVVAMAQVVPISLSGLGVREGMLVLLLHPLGVSNGQAIGIGLLWYLVMLLVSLLGAPSFAVGGRRRSHRRADARR